MFRGEMEGDRVAEVVVDAAMTGDEAHNAFGQVGVEVVADESDPISLDTELA